MRVEDDRSRLAVAVRETFREWGEMACWAAMHVSLEHDRRGTGIMEQQRLVGT